MQEHSSKTESLQNGQGAMQEFLKIEVSAVVSSLIWLQNASINCSCGTTYRLMSLVESQQAAASAWC